LVDRLVCEDGDGVAAIDRSAVGVDSGASSGSQSFEKWRPSVVGRPEVLRGHPVDSEDGRALERVASAVRQFDDVLASSLGVVEDRSSFESLACVSIGAERARTDPVERVLHRRDLRPGKKGGQCVGPTKRGKGTKLMVLGDGASTPLGIHVDSASPAEVLLVDKTLDSVSVARAHHPDWKHRSAGCTAPGAPTRPGPMTLRHTPCAARGVRS